MRASNLIGCRLEMWFYRSEVVRIIVKRRFGVGEVHLYGNTQHRGVCDCRIYGGDLLERYVVAVGAVAEGLGEHWCWSMG